MRTNYMRQIVEGALTRSRVECWPWPGKIGKMGYAQHLAVYKRLIGPVPKGLELDHLCRNRACVNPFHLEPVTRLENQARSPNTFVSINGAKTHCPRGHPYDETNTILQREGRHRVCHICRNLTQVDRQRRYFERKKGRPLGIHNGLKTHCSRGHPFTPENTALRPYKYGLSRRCRACSTERSRESRERQRQARTHGS